MTNNISSLVHTSSSFVRVGMAPVLKGDESLLEPDKFLLPFYSKTKSHAEKTVLHVNGTTSDSGND